MKICARYIKDCGRLNVFCCLITESVIKSFMTMKRRTFLNSWVIGLVEKRYRKIIAKIMLFVMIAVLTSITGKSAYAEEESQTEYNTSPDIIKDHYFGDIKFENIILYWENGLSTLICDVTNSGSELFQGMFRLIFFDQNDYKMVEILGYVGDELLPGETRTMTSNTDMNLMAASRLEFSMNGSVASIEKMSIIQRRTIENLLNMDNIKLFSNRNNFWTFEFTLDIEDYINYTMPESFELYITFKDDVGEALYEKMLPIQVENWEIGFQAFYTTEDLSNASYLEVRTNLPPYTPIVKQTPTPEPTPTLTPTQVPEETVEPTSGPVKDYEENNNPNIVKDDLPTNTPAPDDVSPLPSALPELSLTLVSTHVPKVTKLMKPKISIVVKKYTKNTWVAKIWIKKYKGTNIEIYYRRGKGKFKKIKLKQTNIKKNKKIFRVGYKKGKKIIYIRVRTYQKKGGKKVYSPYSKSWRVR